MSSSLITGGALPAAPAAPPTAQHPGWQDQEAVDDVTRRLAGYLPLVLPAECDRLRARLAAVARGEAFLLQGGDCAETFDALSAESVAAKLDTLFSMAGSLTAGARLPVVVLGRIAGQFAKPRSQPTEVRGGVTLPAYRGDAVNGLEFSAALRTPNPYRMLRMYGASAAVLNSIRALSAAGEDPQEFFVSHEALLLDYERPLTRLDPRTGARYAGSGHLLWAGERTRQPDGAHIGYLAGIANPIAVKLGPRATAAEAVELVRRLDPERVPGRLTFVVRMGAQRVREVLPDLVDRVTACGARVGWVCDPMHGNTYTAPSGHKTRAFGDIVDEVSGFFEVHRSLGTHAGGIHVEMTGEDVTECVGGSGGTDVHDLPLRYASACDPRLSRDQSLELAGLTARIAGRSPIAARPGRVGGPAPNGR
ncbi:3-deoxy-7-phosphoheptulonate synthase [Streptomyces sp. NBC_00190]|uniref:3-deoxy-7-phosphoheptulonate synthase class II n=1 Tax=unclassified Streptomyces TaxID=2593676 RepID=UPI002E2CDB43|nr:3-deoxy-7-phosphoheptulonate synthase class II [Streptomyces sp. NBC_00190]WSZ43349.1 3-deoxy-7-phosphoheptulonate synthase [Streptomyces sp. NBC_00868]